MAAKKAKQPAAKKSTSKRKSPSPKGQGEEAAPAVDGEDAEERERPLPDEPRPRALAILDGIADAISLGRGKRREELIFAAGPEALDRPLGDPAPLDEDWAFCVPAAFCDALDVKATARRVDGVTHQVVTQGTALSFGDAALLYDACAARTEPWGDALASVGRALRVDRGLPASASTQSLGVVECTLFERRGRGTLVAVRSLALTQVGFVRALITGELAVPAEPG